MDVPNKEQYRPGYINWDEVRSKLNSGQQGKSNSEPATEDSGKDNPSGSQDLPTANPTQPSDQPGMDVSTKRQGATAAMDKFFKELSDEGKTIFRQLELGRAGWGGGTGKVSSVNGVPVGSNKSSGGSQGPGLWVPTPPNRLPVEGSGGSTLVGRTKAGPGLWVPSPDGRPPGPNLEQQEKSEPFVLRDPFDPNSIMVVKDGIASFSNGKNK